MADYAISGVWKDNNDIITHYAVHHRTGINGNYIEKPKKYTKADAIALVATPQHSVFTVIWNYTTAKWRTGALITVVGSGANSYLRTNKDSTVRDNLDNLINYGYITSSFS
ncbi:DUF3892 domain-containing protein [Chryseobacterium mucoviscidosis]|uniref:DUF3892 domain-containing protein n=1 Tax=Chryseobacterium mucoviscidosis TaxID=1945581 RepID=UPI0031D8D356